MNYINSKIKPKNSKKYYTSVKITDKETELINLGIQPKEMDGGKWSIIKSKSHYILKRSWSNIEICKFKIKNQLICEIIINTTYISSEKFNPLKFKIILFDIIHNYNLQNG